MVQIGTGIDKGAAGFGHLLAIDGEKTVHAYLIGRAKAGAAEHGGPEQGVEVDDVLADKMVQLAACAPGPETIKVDVFPTAEVFEAGHVADGGIQPDVEVLARGIGNFKTEIRGIPADIPLLQAGVQPLAQFIGDFLAHVTGAGPVFQKVRECGQGKKIMGRGLGHRRGAGYGRFGIDQVGGGVGGATGFAIVAILVLRLAPGAGALDVAVGQKQVFFRIIGLGDFPGGDMAIGLEPAIDFLRQRAVFLRMGRMVVIEFDQEVGEVPDVLGLDLFNELLGADTQFLGLEHYRGSVSIIGADVVTFVPPCFLETHPDIGLYIFDQMAQVDGSVGVGQGAGDKDFAATGKH